MQKTTMPPVGAELELKVSDLNTDGSAVARADGLVFFIDAGLPGESLRARVEGVKKKVVLARRLATLRPSPDEVEPFCAYFGECGGCAWQNLDYPAQLAWKRGRVEAALRRIAKIETVVPPVLPSPALQGFRNKMEYAFGRTEGEPLVLGLRRRGGREVCPVSACPLQSPGAGAVLQATLAWARRHGFAPWDGRSGALRHLILRESAAEGGAEPARLVELVCGPEAPAAPLIGELYAALEPLGVRSFTLSQRRDGGPLASGGRVLRRLGLDGIAEKIGPLVLQYPAQGFVQTNAAAAGLLYEQVRELAALSGAEEVWDIYSGVGALGLYLAGAAKSVLGLEISGAAVAMAEKNAAALGLKQCRFLRGDAAQALDGLPGRPDVLITDPPRGGLSARIIPAVKRKSPSRLIYVSCDPATLARDLAALAPEYRLREIRAVDMFPHTPHVECAARLDRLECAARADRAD